MYRVLAIAVVLIVYGSLWPWRYNPAHATGNPLWVLLHSWTQNGRADTSDIVINLLLYIPIGMFGYMALDDSPRRRWRVMGPVLLGLVLSAAVEMTQIYDKTRNCSALDLLCNTVSAAVGVPLGYFFRESLRASYRRPLEEQRLHASGPLVLLYLWVGFELIPMYPLTRNIAPKLHALAASHFSKLEFVVGLIAWLAVARLLEAIYKPATAWRVLLALSVVPPLKIFVATRQPGLGELAGVAAALFVWKTALGRIEARTAIVAAMLILLLVVQGLYPYRFTAHNVFGWVPFLAVLRSAWESGLAVVCEKSFWYGASVWSLWAAGQRLRTSTAVIAALLTVLEIAQLRLPGRTAEVTDPVLAILLGSILWFVQTHRVHSAPKRAGAEAAPEPVHDFRR